MKAICAFLTLVAFLLLPRFVTAEALPPDGIRVVVHDFVITQYDVAAPTTDAARSLMRQYRGEELEKKVAQVEHDNLEELVNRKLILHEFTTAGYNLPESVID